MTFAKGGLILGPGTVKARVRSWECVIGRDGVCLRGDAGAVVGVLAVHAPTSYDQPQTAPV